MSREIQAATDWLRIAMNAMSSNAFTAWAWVKLITDPNAIRPVMPLYDNGATMYGVYTKADGTTLRLSDGAGATASADAGSLTVGTWAPVLLRGWVDSGTDTLTVMVGNASARADKAFPAVTLAQLLLGTDFATYYAARFAYWGMVNVALSDAECARVMASPSPMSGIGSGSIILFDKLQNSDPNTIVWANQAYGAGMSNTQGAFSTDDPTFGPVASGSCVLPIA